MTEKQRKILEIIVSFQKERGYFPTLAEIATAAGLAGPSSARVHVSAMVEKGILKRQSHKSRVFEICAPEVVQQ